MVSFKNPRKLLVEDLRLQASMAFPKLSDFENTIR